MTKTLDQQLQEQGFRVAATLDRSDLFERAPREIIGLQEMDYYILPCHLALGDEPMGSAYDGLHRIYIRHKSK